MKHKNRVNTCIEMTRKYVFFFYFDLPAFLQLSNILGEKICCIYVRRIYILDRYSFS